MAVPAPVPPNLSGAGAPGAARKIHPADLSGSADKVFDFLSGRMGGRQRYVEKHGHSMLRRRHFPYAIGPEERNQRLLCMRMALEETVAAAALRTGLYAQFARLGEHMRNRGADVHSCGHAPVDGRSSRSGPMAA